MIFVTAIIHIFALSTRGRMSMSESDVYRRQILTSNVYFRAVKVKGLNTYVREEIELFTISLVLIPTGGHYQYTTSTNHRDGFGESVRIYCNSYPVNWCYSNWTQVIKEVWLNAADDKVEGCNLGGGWGW